MFGNPSKTEWTRETLEKSFPHLFKECRSILPVSAHEEASDIKCQSPFSWARKPICTIQ